MKHLKIGRKFSRTKDQRTALLKILIGELLIRGKITTTEAKAKELKGIADKLIVKSKLVLSADKNIRLSALRFVLSRVPRNLTPQKTEEMARKYADRKSGFAKIVKIGRRKSDGASMAVIELLEDAKS